MSFDFIEHLNQILPEDCKAVPFHWGHLHLMDLDAGQQKTIQHTPNFAQTVQHYADNGHSATILLLGKPVLSFGEMQIWPGVHELWMMGDIPTFKKNPLKLTKLSRKSINSLENNLIWHRLQIVVRCDNVSAVKWARTIGFQFEGLVRKYTPDGCDCIFYSRIK